MQILREILGALLFVAGGFFTALLGFNLIQAIVVVDASGSPDAHGMATGLSLVGLVFIGLPALISGWLLLQRGRSRK
ncbi:hypothetical protein [Agrilutibacter solisilvae]|uniref:Uncharacterized protein n=1 Tax=Agrilutibacter solisilvae TaxID=2763317 RepID=A0A974Y1A5_9GAMM|nr:hypothetical protein [Lysobacter solisilvae]QSX79571.1 hypothetical protein I8J32_006895 [Lysobacter solisilvae]